MGRPPSDDCRPEDQRRPRPGHLFTDADPDVILAMTADILACLGDFTRMYAGEDMSPDSVRGLGSIPGMEGEGVALAHNGVVALLEERDIAGSG